MSSEPTTYVVKLKNRFPVAERTMAFQFEKPANLIFRPGQWIDITLLNPAETDAEGNVRGFSIASAPYEDTLMVATRMRDTAFKRELARVPLNTEVKISGPGGQSDVAKQSCQNGRVPCRWNRRHSDPEHPFSCCQAAIAAPDSFLLLKSAAGGCAVSRRSAGTAKRKSKLHIHPHHDGDGEITPRVERGNGLHQQRYADEIPRRSKISDLLHRRVAGNG